jgi:hypothetical protein
VVRNNSSVHDVGCIRTYTHAHIHTYTHTHIRTYTHTRIHTYTHTHIHTYTHTHIHTYAHTHIHTYAHTHIRPVPVRMITVLLPRACVCACMQAAPGSCGSRRVRVNSRNILLLPCIDGIILVLSCPPVRE